jgi:hypothetical protein
MKCRSRAEKVAKMARIGPAKIGKSLLLNGLRIVDSV